MGFNLTAFADEMVNVTPVLLRFLGKFFAVFGIVAVIGLLTPAMARKVDALRAKKQLTEQPDDPRLKEVRGIYDAQEAETPDEAAKVEEQKQ